MKPINIAVTGLSGFVGTNLVKYFLPNENVNITSLDLRKSVSINDIASSDVIIHLAGKAHDLKNPDNHLAYFDVNTELTKKLFNLFLKSEVSDFIYFSSVKAAADKVDGELLEDVVPNPKTAYGISKFKAEEFLLTSELPNGKRILIIRPCMIHGPGNKGNLNLLYKVVSNGIPYPLGAFQNHRSFLSVSNLLYVIDRLVQDRNIPGGIYNVADDDPLSTNSVIGVISQALGRKPRVFKINQRIIKLVANIGDLLHLPLNSERLLKLTDSYVVSNLKIKTALNIKKLPVSSTDGLFNTIRSLQKR